MFDFSEATTVTYLIVFITSTLMAYGIIELILSLRGLDRKRIQRRLSEDWGGGGSDGRSAIVKDMTRETKWAMARWLAASRRGMSFRKLCDQAALPWPAHQVLAVVGLVAMGFLMITLVVNMHPLNIVLGIVPLLVVPFVIILVIRNRRMKKFNLQMPEAFELLSQSLRAGHALPAGIQLIGDQMPDPIGTEFSRVHAEQDLGIPLYEALDHLADRVDLLDLRMFVTAVQIQRQTGGDLTEMMDRIAAVIRDRIKLLGHVRALTAEGRFSGLILLLLPFAVLFALLAVNPDHPKVLLENPVGQMLLIGSGCSMLLGMLVIRRIVNFEV